MVDPKPLNVETLDDYVGLPFLNPTTGAEGILKKFQVPGGQPAYYLDYPGTAGAGQVGGQRLMPGSLVFDPRTRRSLTIGSGGTFTSQTLSESDLERIFGVGGAGATGRTQFASEAALDAAQARLADAQARLVELEAAGQVPMSEYDKQSLELERLRLQNDIREAEMTLKMGMFQEFGAERRTRIQEKGAMQRKLLDVGPDPFRQMFGLSGGVQRGITPQQAAVGQAQAFINQPLPQVSMDMPLSQMEAALVGLQGMQAPQLGGFGIAPGAFSMAEGGVIEMEKGAGDVFSMRPLGGRKVTHLVGDGAGIIPGITEAQTIEMGPFGIKSVEVTPLAGGAQAGMQLSGLQALAPLYQGMGLAGIPTTRRGPMGEIFGTGWSGVETLSRLGIQPRLVRDTMTSHVFLIEDGTHRLISPEAWAASGFQRGDIINLTHADVLKLAPTRGLDVPANLPIDIPTATRGFGALGSPMTEATTGAILPAVHKRAGLLGQWERERPDLFNMAVSAYGNVLDPVTGLPTGGLSPSVIQSQMARATPMGRMFQPQRIGWRGTFL